MDWVKSLKEYNAAKGKSGRKRKQVEEERVEDTEEDDTAGSSKQRTLKVKQLSNGTEKKHRPRMVKYIQDKRSRQKCFSRRKITLVKTAKSLHSLTGVAINLEITSESEKGESEVRGEEMATFTKLYSDMKGPNKQKDKSYAVIPRFYYKLPSEDEVLLQKLREESRAVFLQRRSRELLDNEELQNLWFLLDKHHTPPMVGEDQMINYEDFLKVATEAGPKCKPFFTATIFAKLLQTDPYGRISIMQFFNYVMRKVWLHQTRIGLSLYDVAGQGYLKESDLENYILELIPTLPQLDGLEKSFYSFYVCTAVRKFFFFLDPMRTGKIRIQDILACSFLDDLLELRDEDLPKDAQESNWFSAPSALRVYGQYLNLDKDHNGMLSKQELSRYGTGTLTSVFLDRVFQECLTYDGEMDYKTYLDFVLAMENRKEQQALQYFFRLLDVQGKSYLNVFALNYFFRAIQQQMIQHGQEPISFADVKDEIFDMVKPADPLKITLQDLINSNHGETVVSILIDLNGFWTYENREVLMAENNNSSQSESSGHQDQDV